MKRITTLVTVEQHSWLMKQKADKRETLESNIRQGLDLLIKKKARELKR